VLRIVGPWFGASALILGWFTYDCHRDTSAREDAALAADRHDRAVKNAETERLRAALAQRPPTTLGELRVLVGSEGWCGQPKRGWNRAHRASWSYRGTVPVGESRVYAEPGEYVSLGRVEAIVEGCEPSSIVKSLSLPDLQ